MTQLYVVWFAVFGGVLLFKWQLEHPEPEIGCVNVHKEVDLWHSSQVTQLYVVWLAGFGGVLLVKWQLEHPEVTLT